MARLRIAIGTAALSKVGTAVKPKELEQPYA